MEGPVSGAIQPGKLLDELSRQWTELGRQEHPDGSAGVIRARALNLFVVGEGEDGALLDETLAKLRQDHPSRAVTVELVPGEKRFLDGNVSIFCWVPFGKRQQICSEQIQISSTKPGLADLPSVLRALQAPDLPVVLWLRDADWLDSPNLPPILDLADKIVVNSRGCLSPSRVLNRLQQLRASERIAADLSWTRLTRWRETIAQLFTHPARREKLDDVEEVTVTHYGESPRVRAFYLAAWLRNAVGERAQYRFVSAGDREPCQPYGEVQGAAIRGRGISISIEQLTGEAVELNLDGLVKRTVFHTLGDYELLREELSIEGRDAVFEMVLDTAAQWADNPA